MKIKVVWVDANPGVTKKTELFRSDHHTTHEDPGLLVGTFNNDETFFTDTVPSDQASYWYRLKVTFPNGNWSMSDPIEFGKFPHTGPGNEEIDIGDGEFAVYKASSLHTLFDYTSWNEALTGQPAPNSAPNYTAWSKLIFHGEVYYVPPYPLYFNPNNPTSKPLIDAAFAKDGTIITVGLDRFKIVFPKLTNDPITGIWRSGFAALLHSFSDIWYNPQERPLRAIHSSFTTLIRGQYVSDTGFVSGYGLIESFNTDGTIKAMMHYLGETATFLENPNMTTLPRYCLVWPVLQYVREPFEDTP